VLIRQHHQGRLDAFPGLPGHRHQQVNVRGRAVEAVRKQGAATDQEVLGLLLIQ